MTSVRPFYIPPSNCQVPDLAGKWEALFGRRTEGFFVEVGAYDGESYSNTSCLADAGWAGLYIEPIEEFAEKCTLRHAANPRVSVLNCAASDAAGLAQIFIGDTLSTLVSDQVADYEQIDWAKGLHRGQSREIRTARLDSILEEHDVPIGFDVLVVDVEGAEEKVINGLDISKWHPKVILIELEDEHPDFRKNARVLDSVAAIRQKIEGAGYRIYFKDHINSLYVRSDAIPRISETATHRTLRPRVSIGLPTSNGPDLLKQAVDSILAQTFADFELVISDDCSPNAKVAETCIAWAESDPRVIYLRQLNNVGAAKNFLAVLEFSHAPLFMLASDDDLWDRLFLEKAVQALDQDRSIAAWMCHVKVINSAGKVVRKIPNLSRFSSSAMRGFDLARFIADPECLGKANLFYGVFRRAEFVAAIEKARPYLSDWGGDLILLYAYFCRSRMKVDPTVYFYKRRAPHNEGFEPDIPRKYIVPWEHAARYYGAFIDVSRGTRYFYFTHAAVCARYLYDVLFWRLKLKRGVPWLPSRGSPK
jgi:FkbM family methyltransferase